MNCDIDITNILITTAQIGAALLAISVTLLVFVPALIELARSRSSDFLSAEDAKNRLKRGLNYLQLTALLFSLTTLLSIAGLLWQNIFLLISVLLLSFVSLIILVGASYVIVSIARSII